MCWGHAHCAWRCAANELEVPHKSGTWAGLEAFGFRLLIRGCTPIRTQHRHLLEMERHSAPFYGRSIPRVRSAQTFRWRWQR